MKKTTTVAALSAAVLLASTPLVVSASDDYREGGERYEHRSDRLMAKSDLKQYSSDELRIMAYGQALRRYGPGVEVNVDETPDGTYRVQLRDAEQNLMREQEFNRYGAPVRGGRHD